MSRIAYDLNLFNPVSDDWYLRSLSTRRTEVAACYAWFLAECTAMAEDLYSKLNSHHWDSDRYPTVVHFIEASRIKIPISGNWINSVKTLDEDPLKEVLRTVGFVADNIDVLVEKRKTWFGNRYFFDVTFKVRH